MAKGKILKTGKPVKQKEAKKPLRELPSCLPTDRPVKRSIFGMPYFLTFIGPKQIAIGLRFAPSLMKFSVAGIILLMYACEYKTVLQYLPYYSGKYEIEENTTNKPKLAPSEEPPGADSVSPVAGAAPAADKSKC